MERKVMQPSGKNRVSFRLETSYRNYVSVIEIWGWENDVTYEFLEDAARAVLSKLKMLLCMTPNTMLIITMRVEPIIWPNEVNMYRKKIIILINIFFTFVLFFGLLNIIDPPESVNALAQYLANPSALPALLPHLITNPPDYFVTFGSPGWTYLTQTGWFQERFQPVQQFPAPYDAGAPLIVWAQSPSPFKPADPTPITVRSDLGVDLLSYQINPRRIEPGEAVHVQLDWQSQQTPAPYFRTVLRVVAPTDRVAYAQRDLDTPRSLPAAWIEPETIFPERFVLTTTVDIPVGAYLVTASIYRPREETFVSLFQGGDENPLDRVTLGYVIVPWGETVPETAVPLNATFADQINILSCECVTTAVPGQTIHLRFYWEALRPPDDNFTVFVHLLDADGQYITGHDAPPHSGNYDTAAWLPGDIIPDDHLLTLPPGLPAGAYTLRVGLYLPASGQRLSAVDDQGIAAPDHTILLPPLAVVPQNN